MPNTQFAKRWCKLKTMSTVDIIVAVTVHFIVPLAGLLAYVGLVRRMKMEHVNDAPIIELFLIFATYGGLLLVVLTDLLWKWSAMASLGMFYLILGGPFIMGFIAYKNRNRITESKYHMWAYQSGLLYIPILALAVVISAVFTYIKI